jgi:hypothetical protein
MHLTDTFASTAAVTIPVLILAGAVELRNLADTLDKQATKTAKQMIDEINPRFLVSVASSDDSELANLQFLLRLIKVMPRGYAVFVPIIWSMALLFSGITEVPCFLYLASVYTSSSLILLVIIAIAMMMLLLIITPIVQTVYAARSTPYQGFRTKEILARIRSEIPSGREFRQLSTEEQKKKVERIMSIISNDSSDGLAQK